MHFKGRIKLIFNASLFRRRKSLVQFRNSHSWLLMIGLLVTGSNCWADEPFPYEMKTGTEVAPRPMAGQ